LKNFIKKKGECSSIPQLVLLANRTNFKHYKFMKEKYEFKSFDEYNFIKEPDKVKSNILQPEPKEIIRFLPAQIVKADFVDPEVIIPEVIEDVVNGFSWDILERPIFDRYGNEIAGYKQIIRNDNGNNLHVCKTTYQPATNQFFSETVYRLAELTGFQIDRFTELKGGGMVQSWLKAEPFRVNGHDYHSYMVVGNSHTGETPFYIGEYTSMIRCSNQFAHVKRDLSAIHRSNIDLNVNNILSFFNVYTNLRQSTINLFSNLHEIKISNSEIKQLIFKLLEIDPKKELSTRKENILNNVLTSVNHEMKAIGENAAGFFQGITYFTTHIKKEKEKIYSQFFGSSADLHKQTLKMFEL
jgi:hypothetical protein